MWTPKIKAYKKGTPINFPVGCEIKFDGEFVYWNGQNLLNKRQNHKSTISKLPRAEVYGELYFGQGKEFYSEIHSHSGYKNKVILFDTGNYGKQPYIDRRKEVEHYKDYGVEVTPMTICDNQKELDKHFDIVIKQGYEGVVAKPINSLNDSSWVKIKKETTCTLMVKGLRKGKTIPTILMGTPDKDLCSCSLNGWINIVQMLSEEKGKQGIDKWIIGETKDAYLLNSDIRLEILCNGFTPSGKLRHPRVVKIPYQDRELTALADMV